MMANMEAHPFRGLYRTVAWAYVTNGTMSFQVSETEYRGFAYKPDYGTLPWKENYDAAVRFNLTTNQGGEKRWGEAFTNERPKDKKPCQ